jgi:hypothetical protein
MSKLAVYSLLITHYVLLESDFRGIFLRSKAPLSEKVVLLRIIYVSKFQPGDK